MAKKSKQAQGTSKVPAVSTADRLEPSGSTHPQGWIVSSTHKPPLVSFESFQEHISWKNFLVTPKTLLIEADGETISSFLISNYGVLFPAVEGLAGLTSYNEVLCGFPEEGGRL